jgi:hypothetical protein
VFGQAFFPSGCRFRLSKAAGIIWLLFLGACTGDPGEGLQSGRVLSWAGPEGRWVGPVSPSDPGCGPDYVGLMSIGGDVFAFDPFQSTTVLRGRTNSSGDLLGEAVRQIPGGRSVTIGFVGHIEHAQAVERIIGTLASGRCHWAVALRRG